MLRNFDKVYGCIEWWAIESRVRKEKDSSLPFLWCLIGCVPFCWQISKWKGTGDSSMKCYVCEELEQSRAPWEVSVQSSSSPTQRKNHFLQTTHYSLSGSSVIVHCPIRERSQFYCLQVVKLVKNFIHFVHACTQTTKNSFLSTCMPRSGKMGSMDSQQTVHDTLKAKWKSIRTTKLSYRTRNKQQFLYKRRSQCLVTRGKAKLMYKSWQSKRTRVEIGSICTGNYFDATRFFAVCVEQWCHVHRTSSTTTQVIESESKRKEVLALIAACCQCLSLILILLTWQKWACIPTPLWCILFQQLRKCNKADLQMIQCCFSVDGTHFSSLGHIPHCLNAAIQ